MAPRATSVREQGSSEAVVSGIEAPQKVSNRSVYKAKMVPQQSGGCQGAPVKSNLQSRNLQSSTIDGYRSAIAHTLENDLVNISKMRTSIG